jgi:hypothetical protein
MSPEIGERQRVLDMKKCMVFVPQSDWIERILGKRFQNLSLETHDLPQLFCLYIFPFFAL